MRMGHDMRELVSEVLGVVCGLGKVHDKEGSAGLQKSLKNPRCVVDGGEVVIRCAALEEKFSRRLDFLE